MIIDLERYARHLALPDFSIAAQRRLNISNIFVVGAGGLGAASLPYLAGAGIGHITICDDDEISLSNLHRQTIYKSSECGQSKAEIAAQYLQQLNPEIKITAYSERLSPEALIDLRDYNLILDGSDNFATKSLLNNLSITYKIPLLSASVNQYAGQIGIFAGYTGDMPCYHCLFPELPSNARNCNEAGVLGTAAGLTGMYQAHLAILFLTGLNDIRPGQFLQLDFKTMRNQMLRIPKDKTCTHCTHDSKKFQHYSNEAIMIELISYEDLKREKHIIVDVRTLPEIEGDPIDGATHIELSEIPLRHTELPRDTLLAFVCAGNVRSRQAAEYLSAMGYENVIILDKLSV